MLIVFAVVVGFLLYLLLSARSEATAPVADPVPTTTPPPTPPTTIDPCAIFEGGQRYVTERERERGATNGHNPGTATAIDGAGEGLLMALVDALRAREIYSSNPIEPESYGAMTVVTIDGEDVILKLGVGVERGQWLLFVAAPSGKVPSQIRDALASLDDVRNIRWLGDGVD